MNKIIFCLSFLIGSSVLAQDKKCLTQVNFNIGKTFTSFMYEDAEGNTNENLSYRSGTSYSLNLGFKLGSQAHVASRGHLPTIRCQINGE